MSNFMRKPNVLIHLEVSPEESLARIKSRARGCEVTITLDYLRHLHDASVAARDLSFDASSRRGYVSEESHGRPPRPRDAG